MTHIFISYKHEDSDFALALVKWLEVQEFVVWIDTYRLQAGEEWRTAIDTALRESFAVLVIMTPEARKSEYVTYEWSHAIGLGVQVIPVMLRKTPLHPRMEVIQHLDFSGEDRQYDKLLERLKTVEREYLPPSLTSTAGVPLVVQELIKNLRSERGATRREAVVHLSKMNHRAARTALTETVVLKDADWQVRLAGVEGLADVLANTYQAPEGLTHLLFDKVSYVREATARALGQIKDPSTIPDLLKVINSVRDTASGRKEHTDFVRLAAQEALAQFGEETLDQLLAIFLDTDDELQLKAAEMLVNLGDTARPGLEKALSEPDPQTRVVAVDTLRQIGNPESAEKISKLLNDAVPGVRAASARALAGLENTTTTVTQLARAMRDADVETRIAAAAGLVNNATPAHLPLLLDATRDPSIKVVIHALKALAKVATVEHFDMIMNMLETRNQNDEPEDIKLEFLDALAIALQAMHTEEQIPLLISYCNAIPTIYDVKRGEAYFDKLVKPEKQKTLISDLSDTDLEKLFGLDEDYDWDELFESLEKSFIGILPEDSLDIIYDEAFKNFPAEKQKEIRQLYQEFLNKHPHACIELDEEDFEFIFDGKKSRAQFLLEHLNPSQFVTLDDIDDLYVSRSYLAFNILLKHHTPEVDEVIIRACTSIILPVQKRAIQEIQKRRMSSALPHLKHHVSIFKDDDEMMQVIHDALSAIATPEAFEYLLLVIYEEFDAYISKAEEINSPVVYHALVRKVLENDFKKWAKNQLEKFFGWVENQLEESLSPLPGEIEELVADIDDVITDPRIFVAYDAYHEEYVKLILLEENWQLFKSILLAENDENYPAIYKELFNTLKREPRVALLLEEVDMITGYAKALTFDEFISYVRCIPSDKWDADLDDASEDEDFLQTMYRMYDACNKTVVPILIDLLDIPAPLVQYFNILGLRHYAVDSAIAPLIDLLASPHQKIRLLVASTLTSLGWTPESLTDKVKFFAAGRNWDQCVIIGEPAVPHLITLLDDQDSEIREKVIDTISMMRVTLPVEQLLVRALGEEGMLRNSITEMITDQTHAIEPHLLKLALESGGDMQIMALTLLARTRQEYIDTVITGLIGLLKEDTEKTVLYRVLITLLQIGHERAIPALKGMTKHPLSSVRVLVYLCLIRIADKGRIDKDLSETIFTDPDKAVRYVAGKFLYPSDVRFDAIDVGFSTDDDDDFALDDDPFGDFDDDSADDEHFTTGEKMLIAVTGYEWHKAGKILKHHSSGEDGDDLIKLVANYLYDSDTLIKRQATLTLMESRSKSAYEQIEQYLSDIYFSENGGSDELKEENTSGENLFKELIFDSDKLSANNSLIKWYIEGSSYPSNGLLNAFPVRKDDIYNMSHYVPLSSPISPPPSNPRGNEANTRLLMLRALFTLDSNRAATFFEKLFLNARDALDDRILAYIAGKLQTPAKEHLADLIKHKNINVVYETVNNLKPEQHDDYIDLLVDKFRTLSTDPFTEDFSDEF